MVDPTKTVTNPRIAKLIQYEDKLDTTDRAELETYRNQGLAPKKGSSGITESERTAGFLATRVAGGIGDIDRALKDDPSAAKPSVIPMIAGIVGQPARNYANTDERQRVENAQLDLLDSALTLGTGAAYTREQLEGYRQSYFPQLGEGEGAVADKQLRLRRLLESAKLKAGGAAPLIDEALAKIDQPAANPDANKERLNLLEAPVAALDVATGVRGGPLEVDVGNTSSAQTPEFRAGLNALLDDPKTTKDQILEYWDKNAPGALEKGADPRPAPLATERGNDDSFLGATLENADAAVRGVADTATLGLASRAAALGDTVFNGGEYSENVARQRATDLYDEDVNNRFRIAGQLAGGLAIPSGVAGAGVRAEQGALAAGRTAQEARVASRYGIARRMGIEGAGIGGAYGFNSEYGDIGDRVRSGVLGAAGGGALGYGLGRLAGRMGVGPRDPSAPSDGQMVASAAERQGIEVLPADVGGAGTRMATGATAMTLGGIPLADAAERSINTAATARNRIANMAGDPSMVDGIVDTTGAGQSIQAGARQFIDETATRGGKLFEAIPIEGSRRAVLTNTRKALADLTKGMESNPELSRMVAENPRLKSFLDALTVKTEPIMAGSPGATPVKQVGTALDGGNLSWQDMKRFRSIMGEIIGQPGLAEDTSTTSLRRLYSGLSDDMAATAEAAGPKALDAWKKANRYWRGREDRIQNVLGSVLGKDLNASPDTAFSQINRWAQSGGDPARLGRTMRSLPKEEASTVRATLIQRMGQARKGSQDAGGSVFSPAEFVTQWNGLSPRAKATLFNDKDLRAALDDLATVTGGMKAAQKYANVSKTGNAVNGIALLSSLFASPLGTAAVATSQIGAGKLLSSQWMVRALTRAARQAEAGKPENQIISGFMKSLPAIAAKDPNIRGLLTNAVNDNIPRIGSVAASPDERPNE